MLTLFALLIGAPADEPIWAGVRLGMDRVSLRQLHPTNKVEAVPGCPANLVTTFKGDRLTKLYLVQRGVVPGCREKVRAFFEERYGNTAERRGSQGAMLPARNLAFSKLEWRPAGMKVSFAAFEKRDYSFTAGFERRD